MILVTKKFENSPSILVSENCKKKIATSIKEQKHEGDYFYKHEEVKKYLRTKIYHKKCCYCESNSEAVAPFQVEHYRPKGKITEETSHKGYYWLGRIWSNLVLACFWCNNHKDTQFPLSNDGIRVHQPSLQADGTLDFVKSQAHQPPLSTEKPLLLHPEIDDPKKHLYYLPNGEIKALSKRGQTTMDICKLNREQLIIDRKEFLDNYFDRMEDELNDFAAKKTTNKEFARCLINIFKGIFLLSNHTKKFSYLGFYFFRYFPRFILEYDRFGPKRKKLLVKAYYHFLKTYKP